MSGRIQLDAVLSPGPDLRDTPEIAVAAERLGFDGLWSSETQHDPYLPLGLAALPTSRIILGTAIALSFTRSPMENAYTAWDLAALSAGRFILGLGTQVRAHNERRFSVPWGPPAPRLREVIEGMRSIWHSWRTGERLNYRGEHYKFTLMTPFFTPPRHEHPIPIYIAGVNPGLCQLAGELCDGFHVHPLNSAQYLREVVRPAIGAGAARGGRGVEQVALAASVFVVTGRDGAQTDALRESVRQQISFYASTPSYRVILETHGWGEVGDRLSALAARKDWAEMPRLVSEEMLETFAVIAPPDEVGAAALERYRGLVDRIAFYLPYRPGELDAFWAGLIRIFGDQ